MRAHIAAPAPQIGVNLTARNTGSGGVTLKSYTSVASVAGLVRRLESMDSVRLRQAGWPMSLDDCALSEFLEPHPHIRNFTVSGTLDNSHREVVSCGNRSQYGRQDDIVIVVRLFECHVVTRNQCAV